MISSSQPNFKIAICSEGLSRKQVTELAHRLSLPVIDSLEKATDYEMALIYVDHQFVLHLVNEPKLKNFSIDFSSNENLYRLKKSSRQKDIFSRAIGLNKKRSSVVDATGGLGTDSLMLSHLGAQVVTLERSPVVYLLLEQALIRYPMANMKLIFGDAKQVLPQLEQYDVVYMDPMFRTSAKKSALAKKQMQVLQRLHDNEGDDSEGLLRVALKHAKERVVVKRPSQGSVLGGKCDHSFKGKSIRYDLYLC